MPALTKHVYFYCLPIGAKFTHKGKEYCKSGPDRARFLENGETLIMEVHYGCVIDSYQFRQYGLTQKHVRPAKEILKDG